jgi:signal transduction histidine kinase
VNDNEDTRAESPPECGTLSVSGEHGSWLVGGGEMGRCMRARDWSANPLGPLESWPPSLRTVVNLVLGSNFPIAVTWGDAWTQLYNDAFRQLLGDKHPRSMGQAFDECWQTSFPVMGVAFRKALAGATAFDEDQRMFLDRYGYLEETFFTHTFSPIRDETGKVAGLFHPVIEATPKVLAQRRMRALRDLAEDAGQAESLDESLRLAAESLASSKFDLPFLLFYALDEECATARLVAHAGLAPGEPASQEQIDLGSGCAWPVEEALALGRPLAVEDVERRFPGLVCGPYPEPMKRAYVLPVSPRARRASALVIAGTSQRLPMNEAYGSFYELLATSLTNIVAHTTAIETERKRASALAELDRAKTAFFSNVSHEFRTPLTLMIGPIEDELAEQEEPLPPGRHARLEIAHRNSLRLLRMVNTLLDFSHIEAGRMHASFEPVDLAAITEDLAGCFRLPIEKAGLRLSTRLEPLPEPVHVDREMWTKIVLNLLSNALKHTFKGGITVSLFVSDESPDHVELRVDDTGIGIPAKELPRLFQRFHRIKGAASRSDEGTGIGLALVRALVTLHGGEASVVSRQGLGSSFRVRLRRGAAHLPRERVVATAPGTVEDDENVVAYVEEALRWSKETHGASEGRNLDIGDAGETPPETSGPPPRVLCADGNTDMRNYVAGLLGRVYDVEVAADGEAALEAALARPPDLIVLDVMLPGRDGLELLKELRSAEPTCLIPVILLSVRAGEDAALEGLDAGADDYLVKPFSGKALMARVRSNLTLARLRKESADKLAEANKELEAFSYSVSHDLRAPLRAIDGFSKALLSDYADKLDEQGRRFLERVRNGTQRMGQLIDDLLSLSRITRTALNRERVDVTGISRKVLVELGAREPERTVELGVSDGLIGRGDPRLVTVLLENLLGNAWKFTSKQPAARIEVGSEEREGETIFVVRDNGAGFDMEYAHKLFTPFQRLHSASEFQGTGIGLATVYRVVTRHGGRIWAEAARGRGATFFFTLGEQS